MYLLTVLFYTGRIERLGRVGRVYRRVVECGEVRVRDMSFTITTCGSVQPVMAAFLPPQKKK